MHTTGSKAPCLCVCGVFSVSMFIHIFIRYFIQYTAVSKQLARDARLISMAMKELDIMAVHSKTGWPPISFANHSFSDNQTEGSDYFLDYHHMDGLAKMTKAEKLKLIFDALDKKNTEMNGKKGL